MRFCLVYIVVLSNLAVLSSSTNCENPFTASFLAAVDHTVEDSGFFTLIAEDPDLNYFKDVLKFQDIEIDLFFEDAVEFYKEFYGLDFSGSNPNERNERFFENARMFPFTFPEEIKYIVSVSNWIRNGNTNTKCAQVRDGGIMVDFSGNQTLYGNYGGVDGKPARDGDLIVFAIYQVVACEQSPVLIEYHSNSPFRGFEGTFIINLDTYNRELGFGKARGIISVMPDETDPTRTRVTARNAFTFPRV